MLQKGDRIIETQNSLHTDEQLLNQIEELRKKGLPLDVIPEFAEDGGLISLRGKLDGLKKELNKRREKYGDESQETLEIQKTIEATEAKIQERIEALVGVIRVREAVRSRFKMNQDQLEQLKGQLEDARRALDLEKSTNQRRKLPDEIMKEKLRNLNPLITSEKKIDENHVEIEYALSDDMADMRKMRMVKVGDDWQIEKWDSTRVGGIASPVYRAKARLLAAWQWKPGAATPSTDLGELVKSMRAKLDNDDFQGAVRKTLGQKAGLHEAIFDKVKIELVKKTRLVDIQVSTSNADLSASLASAIAEQLLADYQKKPGVNLTIIERASPPRLLHRGALFQP